MEKFEICVNGCDVELEVEDTEIWNALKKIADINKNDFEDEGFESKEEYLEELVDGYYNELCEYFKELKTDDIIANWEMDKEVENFYIYGRNF